MEFTTETEITEGMSIVTPEGIRPIDFDVQEEPPESSAPDLSEEDRKHRRLEEVSQRLQEEIERIKEERRAQGIGGRAKKSDLWRELEAEEKQLKKELFGGRVRVDSEPQEEPEFMTMDSFSADMIIDWADMIITNGLAVAQHPNPESLPLKPKEKKAIKKPLEAVLSEAGAEISPKTALIGVTAAIVLPRLLPVAVPFIMSQIAKFKERRNARNQQNYKTQNQADHYHHSIKHSQPPAGSDGSNYQDDDSATQSEGSE